MNFKPSVAMLSLRNLKAKSWLDREVASSVVPSPWGPMISLGAMLNVVLQMKMGGGGMKDKR